MPEYRVGWIARAKHRIAHDCRGEEVLEMPYRWLASPWSIGDSEISTIP